ncbi:adenosylmethionine-8-amino-7-oxononanoate aminotransferase [Saccharopolyspora erythraea NRRL 2338]|uniref:Adenosylmethionine-8-amino-7-oxononanoate transaminase n=2 Tax=Saccharopolyspora erythraea TaxID=1836 RepID=A4FEX9_SACEN|nr:aspartate aminotransferase family protein [Saccharopolyspora erythraea]EQD82769.1 adenosylmethionine-8-amino-7-oxononanoate aminotransferase [Saccharopolyspora erythraea D]PFG96330.1 adenosylmethionine-8-amino-7-oxononanoate aminotransferase [Saccharopolyspora erythraea NRRL 2338]QRK92845.1 aspartate aminotransferase family protein [Saccharopolyspora erythraea]CAM02604.1 adenosylmethionine-8-amino-7-oxononanoate transaminase [Saccharopolyspora erythraea NRRL 2338]
MSASASPDTTSTRLWHPFANMADVKNQAFLVDRAEGVWVYDQDGRQYLDATASLWYVNIGHGRREIADAVAAQMSRLDAFNVFNDYTNRPAEELAARLAALAPMDDARVFFTSGGADSIETAAKLARLYWVNRGQPQRTHLLSRGQAYHGTHGVGTSIAGIQANRDGFGEMIADTTRVSNEDPEDLRDAIERLGADRVAAFFAEPVIGAGGLIPPKPGYLEAVAKICREYDVLFVADEVICGFGRLGHWFGSQRFDLRPDLITFAKGVTSGYLPLGGVIAAGSVAEPFWTDGGRPFRHGPTYSGHPTVAAAALANLDILEREDLLGRSRELEQPLFDVLRSLTDHPAVSEARGGVGLLGAVELDAALLAEEPGLVLRAHQAIRAAGVITRPLGSALAVSPPLTITTEQVDLIGQGIRAGLDATLS